jgi:flagellar motor protein MotB
LQVMSRYFSCMPSEIVCTQEYGSNKYTKRALGFENLLEVSPSMLRSIPGISQEDLRVLSNVLQNIKKSDIQKEFADNLCVYWHNGVVIEISDTCNRPLFAHLSDELMPWAPLLLEEIASKVLKYQSHHMTVDGHASVRGRKVDCWSLSFRRANTVRHHIEPYLAKGQLIKVIGNGDADLLIKDKPYDPSNMRIAITLVDKKSLPKRQQSLPEHILSSE